MPGGEPRAYRPGDVANGHVLTTAGQWVPILPAPPASKASPALTSLVAGLGGLLVSWVPLFGIIGWILGPMALFFGALGLRRGTRTDKIKSLIGMACGALTLVVCVAWALLFFSGLSEG